MDKEEKEGNKQDQEDFENEEKENAEGIKNHALQEEHIESEGIVSIEELDALKEQVARFEDNYKRALADYQNLQRRTQEEKREWARLSNKDLILKLLPILDTLMLAEKHTKDQNFVLTVQQFLSALEQEGVKRIKTIDEEFNPHTMEAVSTTESKDKKGKVVEEMRAGYMFYDTILRAAQVIVGA